MIVGWRNIAIDYARDVEALTREVCVVVRDRPGPRVTPGEALEKARALKAQVERMVEFLKIECE